MIVPLVKTFGCHVPAGSGLVDVAIGSLGAKNPIGQQVRFGFMRELHAVNDTKPRR